MTDPTFPEFEGERREGGARKSGIDLRSVPPWKIFPPSPAKEIDRSYVKTTSELPQAISEQVHATFRKLFPQATKYRWVA